MKVRKPIITNPNNCDSGFITEFKAGTYPRVFIDLIIKYPMQSIKTILMWLLTMLYLTYDQRKKVGLKLLSGAKMTHDGSVMSDSKYRVNLRDIPFNNVTNRYHSYGVDLKPAITGPFLIYHKPLGSGYALGDLYRLINENHILPCCRAGYWSDNKGDKKGGDLIGLAMEIMNCDVICAIEHNLETIGIDLLAANLSQPQYMENRTFVKYAGKYGCNDGEFHYEEKVFHDPIGIPCTTSTGVLSFRIFLLKLFDTVIPVFFTLQCDNNTGVCSWEPIGPDDKSMNDEQKELLHGPKQVKAVGVERVIHSKTIKDLDQIDDNPDYIIWPICQNREIGMVKARTGGGKTLIADEMAIMMSCGGSIEQRLIAKKPRKVLLVSGEMSEAQMKSRIVQIMGCYPDQEAIHNNFRYLSLPSLGKSLDLTMEADRLWLDHEMQDAEVVILDYLSLFMPANAISSVNGWDKIYNHLRRRAINGMTFLILHQENKQGLSTGTGKITHDVDFIISLDKPQCCPDDETHIEFRIQKLRHPRGIEHTPFAFRYEKENDQVKRTLYSISQDGNIDVLPLVSRKVIEMHKLSELEIEILSKVKIGPVKAGIFISKGVYRRSASNVTKALAHLCELGLLKKNLDGSATYYTAVETKQGDE